MADSIESKVIDLMAALMREYERRRKDFVRAAVYGFACASIAKCTDKKLKCTDERDPDLMKERPVYERSDTREDLASAAR